ncbi:unnamed protein product [Hermetia illucens]|uniref:Uncharacterized protein n=1 Tax=Hermetia illucens TaxID=343691 RepID=A0A7R8YN97_HERIL|nr:unnamed protein product [Hermetia illucens]
MDYWQIVMIVIFVTSLIFVIYYWCRYVVRMKSSSNRRVLESRRTNVGQSPSVYSITTVVLENPVRPRRPSTRDSSLDLPPSYAEATRTQQPP